MSETIWTVTKVLLSGGFEQHQVKQTKHADGSETWTGHSQPDVCLSGVVKHTVVKAVH